MGTVLVADAAIEIELGILPVTVAILEATPQDVAVVNADILGRVVEAHCEMGRLGESLLNVGFRRGWCRRGTGKVRVKSTLYTVRAAR